MILAFLIHEHFKNFLDTTSAVFCGAMRAFADASEKLPSPTSRLKTEATSSTQS
jgi:hypothetical protein